MTVRDATALEAVRAVVEEWDDAFIGRLDAPSLTLAVEPRTVAVEELRARLGALEGVEAAYVKPPDALP